MKRIPELRDLSDDHHLALVLAIRCRRANRPDSAWTPSQLWAMVRDAMQSHLEPHFRIEETILLPALLELGEESLVQRIEDDHAALRELGAAPTPDRVRVVRFGELLESHIRYEERHVFESTQDRLPAKALEAIVRACERVPRVCPASLAP